MLIDIHVHSSRYSLCGKSSPEEMVQGAVSAGLDAIVFTEHNLLFPADEIAALQDQQDAIRILRGMEVTSDHGDDYLVIGIDEAIGFTARMDACTLIRRAHEQHAAVVLAHPFRYSKQAPCAVFEYPIEGVEVLSKNTFNYAHAPACALANQLQAHPTAASDAHRRDQFGLYAIETAGPIASEQDLAQTLASGKYELFVNPRRVAIGNNWLRERLPEIAHLASDGLSDEDIFTRFPDVGYTVIRGLRAGRDVLRPGLGPNTICEALRDRLCTSDIG